MTKINYRKLRDALSAYQRPARWRSIWQLINTLIPLVLLWYLATRSLEYSYWLTLPLIVLLAGYLIRTFIIFHDCGHGSFFKSRRANSFWGIVTGILTLTPFHSWRASHARHHATSGNLDKRGEGDVWMMTRREYLAASRWERLKYRLYRNPIVMFLLGPLLIILVTNRITGRQASWSELRSVHLTNLAVAGLIAIVVLTSGWREILMVMFPALFTAHVAGVWLFYVQHQFEGVYWKRAHDWDFNTAALEGGSFYQLPAILRWFTGSIGYHHLHHLDPRIPNYRLAVCHSNVPILHRAPAVGLLSSFRSLRFRLWDEDTGRLISFREARSGSA